MHTDPEVVKPCSIEFQCSRAHDGDEAQDVLVEVGGDMDVSAHSRHMVQGFQRQGVLLLLDRHGVATDAEFGVEWSDLTAANCIVNL